MKTKFEETLLASKSLHVQQVLEGFEVLLGYETRNKYRILDADMNPIAFAAEASKGLGAAIMRGLFKHWRTFEIEIFDQSRELMYRAKFPFRWFFKALYLENANGSVMGHLEQRFAILYKKFDVYDGYGKLIAEIKSPLFKMWTFEFRTHGRKIGTIQKKWSGAISEIFTDKDNFIVSYAQPDLTLETKAIMLATCLMIDVVYFENNQGAGSILDLAN
jgi:uncharacterized protein YxjI